ncbi:MAG: hypothetical protein ACI8ZM_002345 [Crocinitomix sp.]|jgi:hypothetical protein
MTVARLLTYWISTVLIGSFLAPIFLSMSFGAADGIFGIMLISIFLSLITSLPAVLIFYFVLVNLNERDISKKQKERALMWTHLGCGLATFIVLWSIIGSTDVIPGVAVFFFTYTGIGMLFWYYEFKNNSVKLDEAEKGPVVNADENTNESF